MTAPIKAAPVIVGACLLAPIAGGIAGASINTVPLSRGADPFAAIPRHESGDPAIDWSGFAGPDHYPLVTPHGTIPVEELAFHGAPGRRYVPDLAPPDDASIAPDAPAPDDAAATGAEAEAAAQAAEDELRRAQDIARLSPLDRPAAPEAALVPADPALPTAARGMLTAVAQPALPPGGTS